jgi:hypothetical protein
MRPAKNVLLTGAGFTKVFGGYLGDEMWAAIFSQKEISKYPKLRQILLSLRNYEQAYHEVLESELYSDEEKSAFTTAVETAYQRMHRKVMTVSTLEVFRLTKPLLRGIVLRFAGIGEERGFIFTFNQDLFLEGFFNNIDPDYVDHHLSTPGTTPPRGGFRGSLQPSLEDSDRVTLPDKNQLEPTQSSFWDTSSQSNLVYIKLHGSYGWRSADGTNAMVVGGGKEERIEKEPLLKWYLHLFREVLKGPECNLLVIGYGFQDSHINRVITDSITNAGLKVSVISPVSPNDFYMRELKAHEPFAPNLPIWKGLHRYYCGTTSDLIAQRDASFLTPDGQAFFSDWLI